MDLNAVSKDIERVIVSEEDLQKRVKELAAQVDKDYQGKDLLLIGVLKGAVMAVADLSRAMQRHVEMDWMAVSSYGSIIEDIVDTGLTLSWLKANLESRGVGSVEILTILRKPEAAQVEVNVKYVGFDIPTDFVIGYGLDFDEKYRNLPFIGVLAKHMYS
ncbi:MAG: hypoxanthine phosphoribosyltransferase [Actinobacteria bacterium]|nr:hypoxanthine phosphoribosyltransferase [Actinomycetota bacterium]